MCKIVFSAVATSSGGQGTRGQRGFPSPRITSHTDKHSQDPTQNGAWGKELKELTYNPIQAPEHLRGKWTESCHKIKEMTEEWVIMIEEIHIDCWACLYRWWRVGLAIRPMINDP